MHLPSPLPATSRVISAILLSLTLLLAACSSGGMETSPRLGDNEELEGTDAERPDTAALVVSCSNNDEVRICRHYLPEHNGVRQCLVGYQVCTDNAWGPCLEGVPVDADGGAPRQDP